MKGNLENAEKYFKRKSEVSYIINLMSFLLQLVF